MLRNRLPLIAGAPTTSATVAVTLQGVQGQHNLGGSPLFASAVVADSKVASVASQLGAATSQINALLVTSGFLATSLDSTFISAEAVVVGPNTATVSRNLAAATLTATSTATTDPNGVVLRTLAEVTASATATVENGLSGSVSKNLAAATLSGTATVANGPTASVTRTLAMATLVATAAYPPPQNAHLFFNILRGVD